jgi:hypothetical protein
MQHQRESYYSVHRFYRVSEARDAPDRALPSLRFEHQERLHPHKSPWFPTINSGLISR